MTEQDKKLLLKDLCGRLPHGVKVLDNMGRTYELSLGNAYLVDMYYGDGDYVEPPIKPYLRPMSSMTEEEKKEFDDDFMVINEDAWNGNTEVGFKNQSIIMSDAIDWLNAHHFDYRGLIPKGLALPAPEGMYDLKKG